MDDLFIKITADGLMIPLVMLAVWALLFRLRSNRRIEAYSRILLAGLTAYLCAKLIGSIYQPELTRPFEQLGVSAGASYLNNPGFPSDHMLFATALSLAVFCETKTRKLALVLFGFTALIGLGRVLALVHTPLDVAGGFTIALAGLPWYFQYEYKRIEQETRIKHKKRVK